MDKLRLSKVKIRRIDKKVVISKAIIILLAFLISLYIYSKLGAYESTILKMVIALAIFIIANLILFGLIYLIVGFILGRDKFLKVMGYECHDHRYRGTSEIYLLLRNIFRLQR